MAAPVPADLEDALAGDPAARESFWAMPPEEKDAWIAWVDGARLPRARRRRIAAAARRLGGAEAVPAEPRRALPREDPWVWLIGLALLAGLAAFLVWLTVYHDRRHAAPAPSVAAKRATVPKVTGIRYQSARFQLREAKLGSKVVRRASSKPKGIVLGQAPEGGRNVPRGTVVSLVVSKGQPRVAIPDVVGLTAAAAVKALEAQKVTAVLQRVASDAAPGTVFAQKPRAGATVRPGQTVVLQIAKPKPKPKPTATVTAPAPTKTSTAAPPAPTPTPAPGGNDYTGMRLSQAIQQLAQAPRQAVVVYVTSSRPAGVVVASSRVGSRERLEVSAGPSPDAPTTVPDVTAEDAATAQQDLENAGFTVIQADWPVSDPTQDGIVVAESPAGGGQAPNGAAIVLYVGASNG